MLLLIDADPIVYRTGFAAEDIQYHLVVESPTGEMEQHVFAADEEGTAGSKMKAWKAEHKDWEVLEKERVPIPQPKAYALANAKSMLKNCIAEVEHHYGCRVHPRLFLSGPGNFREEIATVKGYKANRFDTAKPYWYQTIRNYMTDEWGAEVIEGREADDECAILQRASEGASIIATIDKDLDQVPGEHYDYVKKVFYSVDAEEGERLFYRQILMGDSTDNICGAYKVGPVAADNAISSIPTDGAVDYARQVWERILEVYQNTLDKYGEKCPYYDLAKKEGVEAVAIEMARLVKMQDYVGQLWTPPGEEDETLPEQMDD